MRGSFVSKPVVMLAGCSYAGELLIFHERGGCFSSVDFHRRSVGGGGAQDRAPRLSGDSATFARVTRGPRASSSSSSFGFRPPRPDTHRAGSRWRARPISDELASRQLALLLAPPTDDDVAAYYASLLARAGPPRRCPREALVNVPRARVVRGADFAQGERVLCEPPLVGIQQESNREGATVCAQCFRYVGSIERQIATRLLRDSHREACEGVVERRVLEELAGRADLAQLVALSSARVLRVPGGSTGTRTAPTRARRTRVRHERHLCVGPCGGSGV